MNLIEELFDQLRYYLNKLYWDYCAHNSVIDGTVLMYHHITNEIPEINASSFCRIDTFRKTLEDFRNRGVTFVSPLQALSIIKNKESKPFVLVTFDDVPADFYKNAYPILKEMSIPFTLFIAKCFVGKEGMLSETQIKELDRDELCTIGAHTLTHPMLKRSSCIKEELMGSKAYLTTLLAHQIDYLAYPFGRRSSVSKKVMRIAKDTGFKCAFGTIQSKISDKSARYLFYLPRIVIN